MSTGAQPQGSDNASPQFARTRLDQEGKGPAAILSALLLLAAAPVHAVPDAESFRLRVAVLFKVLSYDRALAGRAKKTLPVTIVFKRGMGPSEETREAIQAVLGSAAGLRIQGLKVSVHAVARGDKMADEIARLGSRVIYLAPGLEEEIEALHLVAKKQGAVTVCGDREMTRSGVAVGVYLRERRVKIAVNLARARALGMSLDASLLSVAEVFR